VVSDAAEKAARELARLPPPQLVPRALDVLFDYLEGPSKWRSKVGALEAVARLCDRAKEQVADRLGSLIPRLTTQMQDTKSEVSAAAVKTAHSVCAVLSNPDVIPYVPLMVSCMSRPDQVPEAVKKLSANVWVRDVDGPTLAVVVPMIARALSDRGTTTIRSCVLLATNLFKMVRSANLAAEHTPTLLPGIEKVAKGAAFPEIRDYAAEAQRVLTEAALGGHAEAGEVDRQHVADQAMALDLLAGLIAKETGVDVDAFAQVSLGWVSYALAGLVRDRNFTEPEWLSTYLDPYLSRFMPTAQAEGVAREVQKRWLEIDRVRHATDGVVEEIDEGEELTNISFSLAYGGLLLLNHTVLRLIRGRRYGVCGANGAGKSTLLKAINRHQIENWPGNLTTFYVEHDIDGVESEVSVRDFLINDRYVKGVNASVARIDTVLAETGFDETRRQQSVPALSGGWKMRLALARAMVCQADILVSLCNCCPAASV
jgi:elongation factor 3